LKNENNNTSSHLLNLLSVNLKKIYLSFEDKKNYQQTFSLSKFKLSNLLLPRERLDQQLFQTWILLQQPEKQSQ
jgi:hypothetical protein